MARTDDVDPGTGGPPSAPVTGVGGPAPGAPVEDHRPVAPPGTDARAPRRRVDWELIGCGLHGHYLVGTDSAVVGHADHAVVRESEGLRWYRCLRCDAWVALPPPAHPTRRHVPTPDEIEIPLRGEPLRDRFVLRVIAVERVLHVIVLALLVVAIFLFAAHRQSLHDEYTRVLTDLQGTFGGTLGQHGILADVNKLFALRRTYLYLIGAGLAVYTALLGLETVGLWYDRRWAEYLTFVETSVLVPYELYELGHAVTALKVLALIVNIAILLYLAVAHRLFGVRGGVRGMRARRARANTWEAVIRATPPRTALPSVDEDADGRLTDGW